MWANHEECELIKPALKLTSQLSMLGYLAMDLGRSATSMKILS
jgi:hypothetical protein